MSIGSIGQQPFAPSANTNAMQASAANNAGGTGDSQLGGLSKEDILNLIAMVLKMVMGQSQQGQQGQGNAQAAQNGQGQGAQPGGGGGQSPYGGGNSTGQPGGAQSAGAQSAGQQPGQLNNLLQVLTQFLQNNGSRLDPSSAGKVLDILKQLTGSNAAQSGAAGAPAQAGGSGTPAASGGGGATQGGAAQPAGNMSGQNQGAQASQAGGQGDSQSSIQQLLQALSQLIKNSGGKQDQAGLSQLLEIIKQLIGAIGTQGGAGQGGGAAQGGTGQGGGAAQGGTGQGGGATQGGMSQGGGATQGGMGQGGGATGTTPAGGYGNSKPSTGGGGTPTEGGGTNRPTEGGGGTNRPNGGGEETKKPEDRGESKHKGKVHGDPHFEGAEGGKYDVHGEAGKIYNILSDRGLQMNAEFVPWEGEKDMTAMGNVGVTLGNDQVSFDKSGNLSINGEAVEDGSYLNGAVEKKGDKVTIKTGEYDIELEAKEDKKGAEFLNYTFNVYDANSDGVRPHGLWGQTVDGDGKPRNGDKGGDAQGGGAIEGADGEITQKGDKEAVKLYEVSDLFSTNFTNFNRFS